MINLTPFFFAWFALVLVIACLALYRMFVSLREDKHLHLAEGEAQQIPKQVAVFHRLEVVDRFGKTLTILAITGGIALVTLYLYAGWIQNR
jgi:hypothetical protein